MIESRLSGFAAEQVVTGYRLSLPFVHAGNVLPPIGVPSDFANEKRGPGQYDEPDLLQRLAADTLPIPHDENREGYSAGWPFDYWANGLQDYARMLAVCERHGVKPRRFYDFGGSTGRVFRHFYVQDEPREVWSSDFNLASVRWNLTYMPQDVRVFLNTHLPRLPLPGGYFDFVCAISVFTHIDELETAWLLELRRILRPGGLAYVTIHDEDSWRLKNQSLSRWIALSPNGPAALESPDLPGDRVVFPFTYMSVYNCNVFHTQAYVREHWSRLFEVAEILPIYHNHQGVVVLRNSK